MSRQVLLVDDEALVREVFRIHLEGWGYSVKTAATAEEAVRLASGDDFDLLITDRDLPDGKGADVLQAARKRRGGVPVLMSAEDWPGDLLAEAEELGAATLYKPCDWQELRALVDGAALAGNGA
jgi:DNA-binding response OmpR family regulator